MLVFYREHRSTQLIRWHVVNGRLDHFDLPAIAGYRPFVIQPRLI